MLLLLVRILVFASILALSSMLWRTSPRQDLVYHPSFPGLLTIGSPRNGKNFCNFFYAFKFYQGGERLTRRRLFARSSTESESSLSPSSRPLISGYLQRCWGMLAEFISFLYATSRSSAKFKYSSRCSKCHSVLLS